MGHKPPHMLGYRPHVIGNGPYLCTHFRNTVQGYLYYGEVRLGHWFILAPIGLGNGPQVKGCSNGITNSSRKTLPLLLRNKLQTCAR